MYVHRCFGNWLWLHAAADLFSQEHQATILQLHTTANIKPPSNGGKPRLYKGIILKADEEHQILRKCTYTNLFTIGHMLWQSDTLRLLIAKLFGFQLPVSKMGGLSQLWKFDQKMEVCQSVFTEICRCCEMSVTIYLCLFLAYSNSHHCIGNWAYIGGGRDDSFHSLLDQMGRWAINRIYVHALPSRLGIVPECIWKTWPS